MNKSVTLKKSLFIIVIIALIVLSSLLSINLKSKIYFGIISFILIIVSSYLFWKQAVVALILWVIFAGVVRKWILPQFSDLIFFFNHIILTGIYCRYLSESIIKRHPVFSRHPINIFLLVFVVWGGFCALNPEVPSALVGILGLIIYFYYIPVIYLFPYLFKTKAEMFKWLKIFVIVSTPLLILGVIQFLLPYDHILNQYVQGDVEDIAFVGKFVRITSTFSYITGYTTYLNILILILVYLLSLGNLSKKLSRCFYILFALAIVNLFMTGSRGPFFVTVFSIIIYLVIIGVVNTSQFKLILPRLVAVLIVSGVIMLTPFGQDATSAFVSRTTSNEDIIPRLVDTFTTPFRFAKDVGLYGYGLGTTYQGAIALVGYSTRRFFGAMEFEEEPERIVLEMGVVGFIIVYFLRLLLITWFFNLSFKLKDPELRSLALIILLFQLQFLIGLNALVFNHTSHIFYWFLIGLDRKSVV